MWRQSSTRPVGIQVLHGGGRPYYLCRCCAHNPQKMTLGRGMQILRGFRRSQGCLLIACFQSLARRLPETIGVRQQEDQRHQVSAAAGANRLSAKAGLTHRASAGFRQASGVQYFPFTKNSSSRSFLVASLRANSFVAAIAASICSWRAMTSSRSSSCICASN